MTYNPSGNYCSICNVHDQWCQHIHPPLSEEVTDAPDRWAAFTEEEREIVSDALTEFAMGRSGPTHPFFREQHALCARLHAELCTSRRKVRLPR